MKRRRASTRAGTPVLPEIPGQELEKAAADVARDAGRSLIRGLEAIFGARFAVWVAENQAKAEVARRAIETQGSIEQRRLLTEERRRYELGEIKHQEKTTLAHRRLDRLLIEMAREQENFEAIATRSLTLIEHDPDRDKPREVDVDWMFKFARYAQHVSDSDVQELWARILASAVIEDRQRLSPAALQVMSLMDKSAAIDFGNFCRAWQSFGGFYPAHERANILGIHLNNLEELGLIRDGVASEYPFREFVMKSASALLPTLGVRSLTQRGLQIASAIFKTDMRLSEELKMSYFKDLVSSYLEESAVIIVPKVDGEQVRYFIEIRKRNGEQLPIQRDFRGYDNLPHQLRLLIEWADWQYLISRAPRSG